MEGNLMTSEVFGGSVSELTAAVKKAVKASLPGATVAGGRPGSAGGRLAVVDGAEGVKLEVEVCREGVVKFRRQLGPLRGYVGIVEKLLQGIRKGLVGTAHSSKN